MNLEFWRDRKVLITGHTGFKGSWLCLWLERLGADVVGYALDPPTQPSLFELAQIGDHIDSIRGDIRTLGPLSAVIKEHAPDVVLHLAAQSVVRDSYTDPIETYSTNVMGTACLLEAIRAAPGRRTVVSVTTDKCYQNREWLWGYRENDALGGRDPYSNSKACAELVTQAFRDSFFPVCDLAHHEVSLASARAGNVIGGGDWTRDQLIPDIVRAFSSGKPVLIRQPDSVRPWQHVLDCLSGYLLLAEKLNSASPEFCDAWNFGPRLTDTKPVSWITDFLARAWGDNAEWKVDASAHPHEAGMLRLDSTKATQLLDWHPKLGITDALSWTAAWYKAYYAGESTRELCVRQIDDYMLLSA